MALTAAQMLDELMGKDRNLVPGEKSVQVHWSHLDSCKSFLCGFCPHDLFVNTKADLGPCTKVHDDQLKLDYEKSSKYGRMGYEEDFVQYLSSIQADVDRKIRRGHDRLTITKAREEELSKDDNDKTKMLTDHINQLLEEIESLGAEGKVEEAQGMTKLVEQLKEEKEQSKNNAGTSGQEKQMEVCEVCGAFLIVGDAQSRVDDHLQGKQHVGYAKIRSALEDMKSRPWLKRKESSSRDEKAEEKKDDNERRERDTERESRRKRSRSRSRERRKSRERRRSRDKSDRRDRDRNRERRRSRDRDRDRESRRSHRSRSRSKDKSSRRRSRSRDRDRRRSRNSSRDRRDRRSSRDKNERSERRQSREKSEIKDENEREEKRNSEDVDGPTSDGMETDNRQNLENGNHESSLTNGTKEDSPSTENGNSEEKTLE